MCFVHGDVRVLDDVLAAGEFDAVVECSAEPSVLGAPDYVVHANLVGAYHCLELARRCNESSAELIQKHPTRFGGFASL